MKTMMDLYAEGVDAIERTAPDWLAAFGVSEKDVQVLKGSLVETPAVKTITGGDHVMTVLAGTTGSGKTVAAVADLLSYLKSITGAAWKLSLDRCEIHELSRPRPSFPKEKFNPLFLKAAKLARWPRYEDEAMDQLLFSKFLIIDDLGVEFFDVKGSYAALLDEVIDERYANARKTVLTTNLDVAAFKARYGERLIDRLRESGRFVNVSTPSLRK